jgi:hypothetical protein
MTALQTFAEKLNITSFKLKIIAVIFMLTDHIGAFFGQYGVPVHTRYAGRLAAPIFFFMAAEGFRHTRSKGKYVLRLYAANLAMGFGSLFIYWRNPREYSLLPYNMLATLFLCVFTMYLAEIISVGIRAKRFVKPAIAVIALALPIAAYQGYYWLYTTSPLFYEEQDMLLHLFRTVFPDPVTCEGSFIFYAIGLSFYYFRGRYSRFLVFAGISAFFASSAMSAPADGGNFQWMMIFAVPVIMLYNGKPGKFKLKWFFYVFYPAHMWGLYLLSVWLA